MNSNLEKTFSDRLTTLCDGRPGLRGTLAVRVEASTGPAPILSFISSDDTLDRYDEVIDPAGWKLDNYQRNPVFQNSHQYGDIAFTLGKAVVTRIGQVGSRKALYQEIEFATDVNPMAKIAYGLYRGGFLNAVSVGFIPIKWENGGGTQTSPDIQGPAWRRKYTEQELLEVSAVAVPANPNALIMGLKSGAIETSDLRNLLGFIRDLGQVRTPNPPHACPKCGSAVMCMRGHTFQRDPMDGDDEPGMTCAECGAPMICPNGHKSARASQQQATPGSNARASGAGSYDAQLLQIARDVNTALNGH